MLYHPGQLAGHQVQARASSHFRVVVWGLTTWWPLGWGEGDQQGVGEGRGEDFRRWLLSHAMTGGQQMDGGVTLCLQL